MRRHRGLLLGLALSALIGLSANQAHAETIVMTVQVGAAAPVDLTTFGGIGTATGYSMDATAITNLNTFLTAQNSRYQFSTSGGTLLGGASNFPGGTLGALTLSGAILAVGDAATEGSLTIVQSEDGFTSPIGPFGTLGSSSTGNFLLEEAGFGHTASSSFNGTSTPSYSVTSPGSSVIPVGGMPGQATVAVAPVPTLYTLTNTITFNLAPSNSVVPSVDAFSVIAAITAVPEPASLVMMLTAFPVPIVILGLLRRRRTAA